MKKSAFLFFVCVTFILNAEWWDEGKYDWNKAQKLDDGIVFGNFKKETPRLMRLWVMRIDLSKNYRFATAKKAVNYGETIPTHPKLKIHTLRQKTVDFMTEAQKNGRNMIAAVNGPGWGPWDKTPSIYATNLGLLISDGVVVSPKRPNKRPSFLFYKDGRIELREVKEGEDLSGVDQAITCFHSVLVKSELDLSDKSTYLAPRTGIGLSADKRYMYLMVIDGRQKDFSMGCTVREVGNILRYLGAADGVNMDGGGSSSFVIWDKVEKKAKMLNHQPMGVIRPVGASLGIIKMDK
jgi:hypothetical protein